MADIIEEDSSLAILKKAIALTLFLAFAVAGTVAAVLMSDKDYSGSIEKARLEQFAKETHSDGVIREDKKPAPARAADKKNDGGQQADK